jgi:hypothetical protein
MLHRVDLFFVGAEHAPRIGERSSQLLERRLHLPEACLIPMRDFKRAGPFLYLLQGKGDSVANQRMIVGYLARIT